MFSIYIHFLFFLSVSRCLCISLTYLIYLVWRWYILDTCPSTCLSMVSEVSVHRAESSWLGSFLGLEPVVLSFFGFLCQGGNGFLIALTHIYTSTCPANHFPNHFHQSHPLNPYCSLQTFLLPRSVVGIELQARTPRIGKLLSIRTYISPLIGLPSPGRVVGVGFKRSYIRTHIVESNMLIPAVGINNIVSFAVHVFG